MKKLYKKGTVHPTPPFISDQLSFLPAAIFTLTLALSPDDKEVLAYLLSCSSNNYTNINNINARKSKNNTTSATTSRSLSRGYFDGDDHATSFKCSCFRCYMSFWVRWDLSPNRQVIHEIIDAFEDGLTQPEKKEKGKKERRRKSNRHKSHNDDKGVVGSVELSPSKSQLSIVKEEFVESDYVESSSIAGGGDGEVEIETEEELEVEKGSIRRFVSFVGEKIWGVWN